MADGKKKGEEVQWQIQGVVYKGCNLSLKLEKIKKEKINRNRKEGGRGKKCELTSAKIVLYRRIKENVSAVSVYVLICKMI